MSSHSSLASFRSVHTENSKSLKTSNNATKTELLDPLTNTTTTTTITKNGLISSLTKSEIEMLKKSWFVELVPQFPEEIIGRQYGNISEALKSEVFWNQIPLVLQPEELELINEIEAVGYHQTTDFTKCLVIAMVSIDNLDSLDSYLNHWGLTQLRIYNTNHECLQLLKLVIIELLKLAFADAFDTQLQHCWIKFLEILITKITKFNDLKFKYAEYIYANEDALVPTTILSVNSKGEYLPLMMHSDSDTTKKPHNNNNNNNYNKKISLERLKNVEPRSDILSSQSSNFQHRIISVEQTREEEEESKKNLSGKNARKFKHSILGLRIFSGSR